MKLKYGQTQAGFPYLEFKDRDGNVCSIQQSSLATENAIWLGIDDAKPMVMNQDAYKAGVEPLGGVGWRDYPLPKEVLLHTRMHLTAADVQTLIRVLEHWYMSGKITKP
jgi:hypothetical protein